MSYYNQFANQQVPSQYPFNPTQFPSPYSSISSPGISSSPQPRQQTSNVIWVQGIEAARSYNTSPGVVLIMLDSDDPDTMYIKSCDNTGRPSLDIYDYHKREPQKTTATVAPSNPDYVLKKDFEKFKEEVTDYLKSREVKKHESIISKDDESIPYGIRERS